MLPWTGLNGAFDTLCLTAAGTKRPALVAPVDAFAAAAGVDAANGWTPTKRDKMRLRSFMSAAHQQNPYLAPAWVWRENTDLVPISDAAFDQIAEFLRNFPTFLAAT
jgi:hypothetical protein